MSRELHPNARPGNQHGRKHGHAPQAGRTSTYRSWDTMRNRCLNPNADQYPQYGGRGITICARWATDFNAFLADMGERPAGCTLDRHPNKDGNYEPGNCRWATPKQQARNRSNNTLIEYQGRAQPVSAWCEELGIVAKDTVLWRLKKGWDAETALTKPSRDLTRSRA